MKAVAIPSVSVAVVVLCLALANSGAEGYSLAGLASSVGSAVTSLRSVVSNVFTASGITNTGQKLEYTITNNVLTINQAGGGSDSVGIVSLPLNTLCQVPGVNDYLVCYICNDDCIYVHNTLGGTCGPNPAINGSMTCLCANKQEEATARGIISNNTKATCQAKYVPGSLSNIAEPALIQVLRARMAAVQCLQVDNLPTPGYNSTGCAADCTKNHGYTSGVCNTATPKVGSREYFNQEQPAFCTCLNSTSDATTTTTTSTQAPATAQ